MDVSDDISTSLVDTVEILRLTKEAAEVGQDCAGPFVQPKGKRGLMSGT